MKKIVCIICLIVSFVSANNIIPDPYKGQVYYKYYVGINLGMDGTEFTKKYTKDEWGEVFANRGEAFFKEFNLVLKPGGSLVISTPNILSMKSRLQFFSSGYYWSFDPLSMNDRSGLQHVTGRTVEQYQYMAMPYGLELTSIDCDKFQSTSKGLLLLYPLMYLSVAARSMKKNFSINNTLKLMLSRIIIMTFENR